MLATFVIGLREGLEAALIVSIIAAFLRNNGKSLAPMWLGVTLAVMLSLAVGVGLALVERALPQSAQEGLETIIGIVAIFFVTGMIVWMNAHARDMKRQLEAEAAQALGRTGTYALASMAFLAVLKEGFETSVFLLATFSVAQSAALAAVGAVIGLLAAIGIGWGIYAGGVKINLSRFFRSTAAFLILVAAGLVVSSLRTAHEAGWLNAGQQATVNLDWLVAPGTVQSALITGVLGIPADPRLIEVLGWFAYLIPVALFLYWPQSRRPGPRTAAGLKIAVAATVTAAALGLAIAFPSPHPHVPAQATLITATKPSAQPIGTARLSAASGTGSSPAVLRVSFESAVVTLVLPENKRRHQQRDGIQASTWTLTRTGTPPDAPSTLTLQQVVALSGGRVPIGLDPRQHPGPFAAEWSTHHSTRVWSADGVLLDATGHSVTIVTLSGNGLRTPRTLTVNDSGRSGAVSTWRVSPAYINQAIAELKDVAAARTEQQFWAISLPILLVLLALLLAASAWRTLIRLRDFSSANLAHSTTDTDRRDDDPETKGAIHAAH